MATKILDYLKLPNPKVDASQCKPGSTTKTPKRYRAHIFKEWEDLTWAHLGTTFQEILQAPIKKRKIKNRREVSPKRRTLKGEDALTALVERWNEPVVQSALDGTQERLDEIQSNGPGNTGRLQFTKNVGQCNIFDERNRRQRPDLCIYQEGRHDPSGKFVNLVPGEIKTARKWKSEWIDTHHKPSKKQARKSLTQVTKYLTCEGTRYGFILTDEELVPIRLSKALRDISGEQRQRNKTESDARNILDSVDNFEASDEERSASPESVEGTEADSQEAYDDSERLVDLVLEWKRIPWAAEDPDGLTINLVLFCLSLLALQSYSIKESGKYTSLGRRTRGQSLDFVDPSTSHQLDAAGSEDELVVTPGKRKVAEVSGTDENLRRSKRLRRLPEYVASHSPTVAQMGSSLPRSGYLGSGSTRVNTTPSSSRTDAAIWSHGTLRSSHGFSNRGARRSTQHTPSRNSSFRTDWSSQSTDPLLYASFRTIDSQT